LRAGKNGYELASLGFEPLGIEAATENGPAGGNPVTAAIGRLFAEQGIGAPDVVTSVSGSAVIVKQVAAPPLDDLALDKWVRGIAAQHVPFEPGDVDLSYQLLDAEEGPSGRPLLLVAAKKDVVRGQSELIRQAGRNPVVMDVDAFALANCYEVNYAPGPGSTVALVNVGDRFTNVVVLRGALPLFTRDISVGGSQFTEAIAREFGIDSAAAESVKRGESQAVPSEPLSVLLQSFLELAVVEIRRTLDFYRASGGAGVERLLLSGGSSRVPHLAELLADELAIPVEENDPFRAVAIPAERFDESRVRELAPQFNVSVGLALRSFDPA
jgi:type IV pilus assembly protein PilM